MLTDQLSSLRASDLRANIIGPRPGYGYGIGFAIRTDNAAANTLGTLGSADWNGIAGTHFWIDPREDLAVVWMRQAPAMRPYYRVLIANRVYAALLK